MRRPHALQRAQHARARQQQQQQQLASSVWPSNIRSAASLPTLHTQILQERGHNEWARRTRRRARATHAHTNTKHGHEFTRTHTHTHTLTHTHSHTRTHLRSEEHEANESSFRQSMSSVGSECSANCCTTVPRAASHTIAVCARARARDAAGHDVGVDARRPRRHARRRREQQQRVHARARTHLVNGAGQQIGARGVPPERENGPRVLRSAAAAGGHHH